MESIDQKSCGDAYRLRHVVVRLSRTFLIASISLRKYGNRPWRRFQRQFGRIGTYFLQIIHPHLPRPTSVKCLPFCLRLADRTLGIGVIHTCNVPWLVFAPLGAVPAESTQVSITARSISSSEKSRAVRRVARRFRYATTLSSITSSANCSCGA